jgi:hypothetical protein
MERKHPDSHSLTPKQSFGDRDYNRMYTPVSSLQCARYGIQFSDEFFPMEDLTLITEKFTYIYS